MELTHPDILRAEKFGSYERSEEVCVCVKCEGRIDAADDEPCEDGDKRVFCSEKCFLEFYGYRRLRLDAI